MVENRCQVLKNSSKHDDIRPIKIALIDNCNYILIDLLNAIIESLRMPYVLTFHKILYQFSMKWLRTGVTLVQHIIPSHIRVLAWFTIHQ